MASTEIVIRARKFIANPLLARRQFVLDIYHPQSASVSRVQLRKLVAAKFGCPEQQVVTFGLKTKFGGGKSSGFGLIYDSVDQLMKYESKVRLVRNGLAEPVKKKGRRLKKEEKNKRKKIFGVKKEKK
ncbi:MAG: hypothetical protein AAFO58_13210 [Pseudomonadota bacterium]